MVPSPPSTTPVPPSVAPPVPASGPAGLELCHIGVVLRSVIGVEALLAVGTALVATDANAWLLAWSLASVAALPGVLAWLVVVCAARQPLAALGRRSAVARALATAAAGAAAAAFGLALRSWALDVHPPATVWLAALVAGAGLAWMFIGWLELRARAGAPAEARARLAQLQASIRPHFLFNTLNSAVALVRLDPERAESVLEDLAELFRIALAADQNPAAVVTLDDELALARRYLAIEEVRFGPRLQVRWELDAQAGSVRLPLLLLQPLVENAVRHGIEPADEGGLLRIRTQRERGRVVVSVANTLPLESVPRPGAGMALRNVRERLQLLHDVNATFAARREGDVFRVHITLPLPD